MSGNFVSYQDANVLMTKIARKISDGDGTIFTRTLTAGSKTITISDTAITTDSMIDVYTSVYGIAPTDIIAITGSVTITFNTYPSDISVKVVIK